METVDGEKWMAKGSDQYFERCDRPWLAAEFALNLETAVECA